MYVATQAIPQIVSEYLSGTVLPKAPTPLSKFGLGFMLPYIQGGVQSRLAAALPMLQMMTLVDEHGRVDLDKARSAASEALEKAGGRLTVSGYTVDQADLDALFQIAQQHAVSD